MRRKPQAILLKRLAFEAKANLDAMAMELTGDKQTEREGLQRSKWSRPFAASGKIARAPKIREV